MAHCPNCGAEIQQGSRFCRTCGASIPERDGRPSEGQEPRSDPSGSDTHQPSPPPESPSRDEQPPDRQSPGQQSPDGQPPDHQPSDERPPDHQPSDGQPSDGQPPSQQPPDGQPSDGQPPSQQPPDGQQPGHQPSDRAPADDRPPEHQSQGHHPGGRQPQGRPQGRDAQATPGQGRQPRSRQSQPRHPQGRQPGGQARQPTSGQESDSGGLNRRDLLKFGGAGAAILGISGLGWAALQDGGTTDPGGTTTSGGGDGTAGGGGGGDGGAESPTDSDGGASAIDFGGWFAGVDNYDGRVVDERGTSRVTVLVGAEGNGGAYAFGPPAVHVDPGATVVWEWTGEADPHGVVHEGNAFASPVQGGAGTTFSHTFETEGIFRYYCPPHESLSMKGAVVVGESRSIVRDAGGDGQAGEMDPIQVGALLSDSPYWEQFTGDIREAIELAATDINDAGGPLGRRVEFDVQTTGAPDEALPLYQQFVDEGTVGVIGPGSENGAVQVAEMASSAGVPIVSPVSRTPQFTEAGATSGTQYAARTVPNDIQQGAAVSGGLGVASAEQVAFLAPDIGAGRELAEIAGEAWNRIGRGEVTDTVFYQIGAGDFTSHLEQVFAADPDGVGFFGIPNDARAFLQQHRQGGYGGQIVLGEWLDTEEFLSEVTSLVEGKFIVSASADTPGADPFRQRLGGDPRFAANAYDAAFLLALAIERAGEASGEAIAENIRAVSRPPGETITVDEFDRAVELLDSGADINYEGASSTVDLTESLEPVVPYDVSRIGGDGSKEQVFTIPADFFERWL
jgi:halocyanin-like protein